MKIFYIICVVVLGVLGSGLVWAENINLAEDKAPPGLVISAVNVGYTDGDVGQNYDFVELYNMSGEPVLMDGYELVYINSAGNAAEAVSWPEGTWLNAEYLVLGYEKSPQFMDVPAEYLYEFGSAGLASTSGSLRLIYDGETLDEVCWGSAECDVNVGRFATDLAENQTVQRCIVDGLLEDCVEGGQWQREKYYPELNAEALLLPEIELPDSKCFGLVFSEIYSYFELDYAEQFVEIYNPTDEVVELEGCGIAYKNKTYALAGELLPEEYLAYRHEDLRLTKNPSNNNAVTLMDADGSLVAELKYYHGQKKGTSWSLVENEWRQTYAVTEGEPNTYQEFRTCPAGKVINPQTGNCINFYEEEEVPPCPVGKFRNPETNRCKSYESLDNVLKECGAGYYRHPDTNRCRKIATEPEVKPCEEGYERNPETNRCRKIRINNGADFGVTGGIATEDSSWIGYGAFGLVVLAGLSYVGWQFRAELKRVMIKGVNKLRRK